MPFEQLAPDFVRMHQAGLIRAIASALDCLAGVIIRRRRPAAKFQGGFSKKARAVAGRVDGMASTGAKAQADFARGLETAIDAAGRLAGSTGRLDLRTCLSTAGAASSWVQYLPITPCVAGTRDRQGRGPRSPRVSHLPAIRALGYRGLCRHAMENMVLHEERNTERCGDL